MLCSNCGHEFSGGNFCPECGHKISNILMDRLMILFKGPEFLVICISISVNAGFSILSGQLPVIRILISIFLWIIYSEAKQGIFHNNSIKNISGSIFASYIINYILAGLIFLSGFLFTFIYSWILNSSHLISDFWDITGDDISQTAGPYLNFITDLMDFSKYFIIVIFVFIALAFLFFNIFATRYFHKFVQSIYRSIESGNNHIAHLDTAKTWFLVLGILNGISTLFSLNLGTRAFLTGASMTLVYIFAYISLGKHLVDKGSES